MKQAVLTITLLLAALPSFGQQEHLEPAKDFKQYDDDSVLRKYYDNVFCRLYKGFAEKPFARYTSMPSFSHEHAFSVETIDSKHYIISNRFSGNYWYAKRRNAVRLITGRTEIDSTLYSKMGKLFQLLAEQIKEPEQDVMGLDGVTYYFSTTAKSGEVKTGETWSPKDGSLLSKLVEICDTLYAAGIGNRTLPANLSEEIDKLVSRLMQ